jgi:hypothetical protein
LTVNITMSTDVLMMFSFPATNAFESPDRTAEADRFTVWTPALEHRAVRLYLQEGLTAAEVAYALGGCFSRAAVISKIRRLGFLKREARKPVVARRSSPRRCEPIRTAWRSPPQRPPQPLPPLREIGPTVAATTLAHLFPDACRWPIDDPGPGRMHLTLFCGGAAEGHSYCAAHRAIACRARP